MKPPSLIKNIPARWRQHPAALALRRGVVRARMTLRRDQHRAARRHLTALAAQRRPSGDPPRVAHLVLNLAAGGAERQITYLCAEAARRGLDHRVVALELEGAAGHYVPDLRAAGVAVVHAATAAPPDALRAVIASLPWYMRDQVGRFVTALADDPPDVVHCWLPHTSVWGGVAGVLLRTSRVITSNRNMNPTHFHWYEPWFKDWSRFLVGLEHVQLINNSRAGARDVARWVGIEPAQIGVVLNGIDTQALPEPPLAEGVALRRALGIPVEAPLVVGVFRLSAEKRPAVFFEAAEAILAQHPDAHVVHVGDGPLEREVHAMFARSAWSGRCHLLGRRRDVPVILSAADVVLLTSLVEGTPNVLLEAQHLRRPVVASDVGGVGDVVRSGQTGVLCHVDDVLGLSVHTLRLLDDPARRRELGERGRRRVAQAFGLGRMVDEMLALYEPDVVNSASN